MLTIHQISFARHSSQITVSDDQSTAEQTTKQKHTVTSNLQALIEKCYLQTQRTPQPQSSESRKVIIARNCIDISKSLASP